MIVEEKMRIAIKAAILTERLINSKIDPTD